VDPHEAMDHGLYLVGDDLLQLRLIPLKANELHGIFLSLNGQDLIVRREFNGTYSSAAVVHAEGDDGVLGGSGSLHHHTRGSSGTNSKYLKDIVLAPLNSIW